MSRSAEGLISQIRSRIHSLLYDEVIDQTILVMRDLGAALGQLATQMRGGDSSLTEDQKKELKEVLLSLNSESIREALHKGELSITNGIIRSKNNILKALGLEIPEGHKEINARDFPTYNW